MEIWQENKGKKNAKAVFGVDPSKLLSTKTKYTSPMPNILIKLRQELFGGNGHLIEGIFRIAPNRDECKNDGKLLDINFAIINGDLIANLMKLWFRSMPNCICQALVGKNKIETCQTVQQGMSPLI